MFQFPTFAFHCSVECHDLLMTGCPIRIPADRFVFANPRGFSQLITSFVAFQSPGIPHVPLFTFISPPGVSLRRAGYDKYTLASLICSNELFLVLFFALVLFHHVKDLLFNCYPTCTLAGEPAIDSCLARSRTAFFKLIINS